MDPASVRAIFEESARVKREFASTHASQVERAAELLTGCFRAGGRVLLFGNGGSAADAQHIAAEWCGRFGRERPGLSAIALSANPSDVTAIGNDYGFDTIFARLVQAHGRPGDVAIALSTSGRSANVLAGAEAARSGGLHTVGLTGAKGGPLAALVDVAFCVPSDLTPRIQETHITLLHVLCELVDEALAPPM
jgi:D-sedoheptulose 7-phosphate isomerase